MKSVIKIITTVIVTTLAGTVLFLSVPANAIDMKNFDPSNIIDDAVFYHSDSMSTDQVQTFLNNKVPSCDTQGSQPYLNTGKTVKEYWTPRGEPAPYVCLKDYNQKTPSISGNESGICSYTPGYNKRTAAQIIGDVARACGISPKVLLVLLQKEQSLVTDNSPLKSQYASATGMGCPDFSACDPQYDGFFNQVYGAARQYKLYRANPNNYNYVAGQSSYIQYNPKASCGGSWVTIKTQATAGLYNYTPYQPNNATKKVSIGIIADRNCGAYGNKNFWWLFTDWFGSTVYAVKGVIGSKYTQLGGETGLLGGPTRNQACGLKQGGCFQSFQNGAIYWTKATGAWSVRGGIRTYWASQGYENGRLGYPISDEVCGLKDGGCVQQFQGGKIYWTPSDGSRHIWGAIEKNWDKTGYEFGVLGYPIGNEKCGLVNGGCFQQFQGGSIYWSPKSDAHFTKGSIRNKWAALNYEYGRLGYPINDEVCGLKDGGCFQQFQGGAIYWAPATGSQQIWGSIVNKWSKNGYEWGSLGYPTNAETCGLKDGGCFQQFQGGSIYWSPKTDSRIISSTIRDKWTTANSEQGTLGYPTKDAVCGLKQSGCFQQFQGGKIYSTPTTGTQSIWGAIERKWNSMDYERSPLGYPTSSELSDTDGSTYQKFQNGRIYWTQARGAWVVYN